MARKTNNTKSKSRPKSGRRKDYTASTAKALRTPEAVDRAWEQFVEFTHNHFAMASAASLRRGEKRAAHAARHEAKA